MEYGHILLHRKIIDSYVFANEKALKIWVWCLLRASYKRRFIPLTVGKGQVTIELKEGEFVYGRNKVSELNINKEVVRYWLEKFQEKSMITIKPTNQYSIITICNWLNYQSAKNTDSPSNYQPIDNQPPSNPQVATTNNNVNNINNINKDNNINVCIGERQIFNSILSFFGFTPQNNPDKATQVSHFVNTLLQNGKLEHFKSQFEAYKEYKAKTAEKTHGFGSFFGEQVQSYTKNGGWNAQNWKNKLKQAENKTATGSPRPGPEKKPMTKL